MDTPAPKRPFRPVQTLAGLAILALVVLLGALEGTGFTQSILRDGWYEGEEGYKRALEESRASQRPVALYFYTDWCGYCRKLERDVLTQPAMQPCLSSVIPVKVNPEKGRQEGLLAQKFGVAGFPRFFIAPPKGEKTSISNALRSPEGGSRLKNAAEFAADCQKAVGG